MSWVILSVTTFNYWFQYNVLDRVRVMVRTVGEEDEAAGRVGKGYASEVCSLFPLVVH